MLEQINKRLIKIKEGIPMFEKIIDSYDDKGIDANWQREKLADLNKEKESLEYLKNILEKIKKGEL